MQWRTSQRTIEAFSYQHIDQVISLTPAERAVATGRGWHVSRVEALCSMTAWVGGVVGPDLSWVPPMSVPPVNMAHMTRAHSHVLPSRSQGRHFAWPRGAGLGLPGAGPRTPMHHDVSQAVLHSHTSEQRQYNPEGGHAPCKQSDAGWYNLYV